MIRSCQPTGEATWDIQKNLQADKSFQQMRVKEGVACEKSFHMINALKKKVMSCGSGY